MAETFESDKSIQDQLQNAISDLNAAADRLNNRCNAFKADLASVRDTLGRLFARNNERLIALKKREAAVESKKVPKRFFADLSALDNVQINTKMGPMSVKTCVDTLVSHEKSVMEANGINKTGGCPYRKIIRMIHGQKRVTICSALFGNVTLVDQKDAEITQAAYNAIKANSEKDQTCHG
jgi:outer membrane murein-binding lipoprotein Lpp